MSVLLPIKTAANAEFTATAATGLAETASEILVGVLKTAPDVPDSVRTDLLIASQGLGQVAGASADAVTYTVAPKASVAVSPAVPAPSAGTRSAPVFTYTP